MNALDIGLRASIMVLIALAASAALRRRSAALRHWVLAVGIVSAAAVAPLGIALPTWDLPASSKMTEAPAARIAVSELPAPDDAVPAARTAAPPAAPAGLAVESIINAVWAAGFVVGMFVVLARLLRLSHLTGAARPMADPRWAALAGELAIELDVRRNVALLQTGLPATLGTWGWRQPCVLLPAGCEQWSAERIRVVLGHELAHIRRGDWALQMATDLVRAVFWYNPLFWLACARLRRESEAACDNAVLDAGVPAADYATHLLDIARTCRPSPALAALVPMARRSTLEWRIAAMLNDTLARTRPTRRALATVFAVIVGITLTTATFRAKQAGPMPFTGTAYDVTGGVLPGVVMTMEDAAGNRATATTDKTGRFEFGVVSPGQYRLSMNALPGFQSATHDITLQDPRQWDVNLTFQVGTLQERITVTEQRPAGAPARGNREPVRIGGNIKPPRKLVDVRPVYPQAMRDAGIDGVVSLSALIDTEGRVVSVRVTGSQAHPELAKAAVEAVKGWQFSPTLLNGDKVEVLMTVSVAFTLQD